MSTSGVEPSCEGSDSSDSGTLSFENGRLDTNDAESLVQEQAQDVSFRFCRKWRIFVAHLASLPSKPGLRHLSIVTYNRFLPFIKPFLELLEPGLETLRLLVENTESGNEHSKDRYLIDNELILKHASTLRHLGILERKISADGAYILTGDDGFSFIRPILRACDLKEVSILIDLDIYDGDDYVAKGNFDGFHLDNLETL